MMVKFVRERVKKKLMMLEKGRERNIEVGDGGEVK